MTATRKLQGKILIFWPRNLSQRSILDSSSYLLSQGIELFISFVKVWFDHQSGDVKLRVEIFYRNLVSAVLNSIFASWSLMKICLLLTRFRDVVRFSNPGGQAVMQWAQSAPPPSSWKRVNETPNSGWAPSPPANGITDLYCKILAYDYIPR